MGWIVSVIVLVISIKVSLSSVNVVSVCDVVMNCQIFSSMKIKAVLSCGLAVMMLIVSFPSSKRL